MIRTSWCVLFTGGWSYAVIWSANWFRKNVRYPFLARMSICLLLWILKSLKIWLYTLCVLAVLSSKLSFVDKTSFFRLWLYGIRPCVSNHNQPHDVVGVTIWLKMWAECRKGDVDMTVNQEFDLAGKSENGRNLGKTIPQTHPPLKKSAGVGHAKCR